jgi:hypothetical protein
MRFSYSYVLRILQIKQAFSCGEEGQQTTLMAVGERFAIAVEKDAEKDKDKNSAKELWDNIKELSDFGLDFLAHYYAYFIENPDEGQQRK